jgi:hypothetical protein
MVLDLGAIFWTFFRFLANSLKPFLVPHDAFFLPNSHRNQHELFSTEEDHFEQSNLSPNTID